MYTDSETALGSARSTRFHPHFPAVMSPTFIVITSFYPAAQQALHYADALASAPGGRLVLLHVNRASLYDPYVFVGENWRRQELEGEADTAALLARLAGQLQAPATVELATDLLPNVAHDLATRYQPALFVLGRPGPENASPEQLSTTTLELLRAAGLPVLLVPLDTAATVPPRQVLIAADGDECALPDSAAGVHPLLRAPGVALTVAHVSTVEDDEGCARALRAVQHCGLTAGLPDTALRGYQFDHPAPGVLAAIADTGADLVLLLARHHSYFGELFHQSVTAQVASQSPVPVLVVPVTDLPAPTHPPGHDQAQRPANETMYWPLA